MSDSADLRRYGTSHGFRYTSGLFVHKLHRSFRCGLRTPPFTDRDHAVLG